MKYISRQPKIDWGRFINACKRVYRYSAYVRSNRPGVWIIFKDTEDAKAFIYWFQRLAKLDAYESAVYFEDVVKEIYSEINRGNRPKENA